MIQKSFIQWEDLNGLRKYPIAENSTAVDDEGCRLEDGIITDLMIVTYVPLSNPRIGSVYCGNGLVSATVVDDVGAVSCVTATEDSSLYDVQMESARDGVFARISFGSFPTSRVRHVFSTPYQSKIHELCVLMAERSCVYGLVDDKTGKIYSGNIGFQFENGAECSVDTTDKSRPIVSVKVSDGLAKALSGGCTPMKLDEACVAPVIQTINGIGPNEFGEIAIVLE